MLKYLFAFLCLIVFLFPAQAQDPQYSQFYAAPLYLSPAFAGSALAPRVVVNYRNQWPAMSAKYVTFSASFDHYFPKVNSGVGLLVTSDKQGFGGLRSTDIGAMYSYRLRLAENLFFQPGFQLSFVMRDINFYDLTFGDQYDDRGFTGNPTAEPIGTGERVAYADFSSGGLIYSERFWVGFSAHHMNRPNQSFFNEDSRLPMKTTVHGGYKIPLDNETRAGLARNVNAPERSITPAFLYKAQGKFDQLDVGLYLTYDPMVFGLWYRGLPIKKYEVGLNNNDAAIFLVGFRHESLSIGYSYDLTVSNLGYSTGGAHEISIAYVFPAQQTSRRGYAKRLPCPKF